MLGYKVSNKTSGAVALFFKYGLSFATGLRNCYFPGVPGSGRRVRGESKETHQESQVWKVHMGYCLAGLNGRGSWFKNYTGCL